MLKRLSNYGERSIYDEIVGAADAYAATIYRKVRLADVVDIKCLSSRELGTFALQSHFDFCICDSDDNPAFAIEYDGGGHDPKNDHKKNAIATEADLALFRIEENLLNHTRSELTFLQYLVHTYFLGEAFQKWRMEGSIDPSEPFMMSAFLKPDAKHIFDSDYDFATPARGRLNKLLKDKSTERMFAHFEMSGALFGRDDSSFVGFASIPIEGVHLFGRAKLNIGTPCLGKLGELPFGWSALGDYCEGMMMQDLCDQVEIFLGGGGHTMRNRADVKAEISDLLQVGYAALRAFGGPDGDLMSYAFPKTT